MNRTALCVTSCFLLLGAGLASGQAATTPLSPEQLAERAQKLKRAVSQQPPGQPAADATPQPRTPADLALYAEAQKKMGTEPLHRIGDVVKFAELRYTLLSFGYALKPVEWPGKPANDPAFQFDDRALHFVARFKVENISAGRYSPVDQLTRVASEAEAARYAVDDWGNVITDEPSYLQLSAPPRASLFDGMTDPAEFTPGGPLSHTGILPPGSTCELQVELQPPLFIGVSKYFIYRQPATISGAMVHLPFFIPVSEIMMPKEGEYIWATPAFLKKRGEVSMAEPAEPDHRLAKVTIEQESETNPAVTSPPARIEAGPEQPRNVLTRP